MNQKKRNILSVLVSLLLCAVVLFTPYIVLNILAERRLIAVSDLSVIKIGTSIWNLLYIWIIAPKVDKKIDKIFEKNNAKQSEPAIQATNEIEAGKEDQK